MPQEPWDLALRIEAEMIARIEEAVDFACLEAMVERRKAGGLPAPVADSTSDRDEFQAGVLALLERLRSDLSPGLTTEQQHRVDGTASRFSEPTRRLVAVQAALARELPDYWVRFEAIRQDYRETLLSAGPDSEPVNESPGRGSHRPRRGGPNVGGLAAPGAPMESGGQRPGLLRRLFGG